MHGLSDPSIHMGFQPFSKECKKWRVDDSEQHHHHGDNKNNGNVTTTKSRQEGISPQLFYCPSQDDSSSYYRYSIVRNERMMRKARKLTKDAQKRRRISDFYKRYSTFVLESFYQEFPLQDLAFAALDELREHFDDLYHGRKDAKRCSGDETKKTAEASLLLLEQTTIMQKELMWDEITPRIFAVETSKSGKRKYIVCHLGRFMHSYWRLCAPHARHFYELIREGDPCRLYFDLEYNKEANPQLSRDIDANRQLMEQFIQQLILEIKDQFNIDIRLENIIDLDSSTKSKFSRHLIVHMPNGELFRDAMECGVFVKNFVGRLVDEIVTGTMGDEYGALKKYFLVNSTALPLEQPQAEVHELQEQKQDQCQNVPHHCIGVQKTPFVDIGVYTRNRLFRLLGSSKFGKPASAALRIAETNQFSFPQDFGNHKFYKPDTEESHTEVDPCDSTMDERMEVADLLVADDLDKEVFNWEQYAYALEQTFVTPSFSSDNTVILDMSHHQLPVRGDVISKPIGKTNVQDNVNRFKASSCRFTNHIGPSPFPSLEEFVEKSLATRKGICGSVRAWAIDSSFLLSNRHDFMKNGGIIIYQMKNNRWCENIQRCHKSNNIMWNVSLVDMTYWQTCHDPDCRMLGFRGEVKAIPNNIVNDIQKILSEESMQCNQDNEDNDVLVLDKNIYDLNHVTQDEDDEDFGNIIEHELLAHPELFP